MSEKVTLADALSNVDVLDELPLPEVPTPESIEAKRQAVAAGAAAA